MARKIYMNVAEGDECRIAVLEDNKLYEYFVDRPSQLKHVGDIYKGIISNIEPGIQAAFVDVGLARNGFLHISDINYAYQGNTDIRELFSRTLRVKEPLPEDTVPGERTESDVEQVDEFVGDSASPDTAREADFLDKLDEPQQGHAVTESPTKVEPTQPLDVPAEIAAEAAPVAEAPAQTPQPNAPQAADGERKRKRRRRRRKSSGAAANAAAAPATTAPTTSAPAPEAAAEPAKAEPASTTESKPADSAAKTEAGKRKRRRTPKRRGGRLPKRVTEGEQAATDSKPESKPIDGGSGGGESPLPGPMYRYHRGPQPKIQGVLRRDQEVVVQVTKASQGGKGPGLSTFVSLPGRYMVLTPNSDRGGVSRKIEDGGARTELRKMLDKLPVPEGMGVIVRTAAINRSFEELHRDLNYLLRVWSVILERIHETEAPSLLYTDSDPAIRTVRDYFTADTSEIVIDDKAVFERVLAFFDQLMPSFRDRVKLYQSDVPLFFSVGLENQLDRIFDKKVNLKSGGYLFVEQTEALISIDVNSGKFTSAGDAEKTAYQTNAEAIPEICRQLRLRDLGGIVCCDLIDMDQAKHRADIENALRRELRKDRARTKVARMSPFGVIEMTRQRVRPSIKNYTYVSCPTCQGFGMVRSAETMCLSLLRRMKVALIEDRVHELVVQVHPHVLSHLHSEFRDDINELEEHFDKRIVFEYAKDLILGQTRFFYMNDRAVRVLYDMDQRVNTFIQGNAPKAQTNVPPPPPASGDASSGSAAPSDGKGRKRRRGGRRQRERELERQQRESRIRSDVGKAVTFGDKLPDIKVEVVAQASGEAKPKSGGRRSGRTGRINRPEAKPQEPASSATKAPESKPSGRKTSTRAAAKPAATRKKSEDKKPAATRQAAAKSRPPEKHPHASRRPRHPRRQRQANRPRSRQAS